MAKTFVQVGDIIDVTAPTGGTTSGQAYLIGSFLFGVALTTVASGSPVALCVDGVVTLPKSTTSIIFAVGDRIYWDNTNRVTTSVTTGNVNVGISTTAAVTAATTVNVLLRSKPGAGL